MSLSEYFKSLPVPVQRTSLAVKSLQRQRDSIQLEYRMACMKLEKQFLTKQQGLNRRRLEMLQGGRLTLSELSAGAEDATKADNDYQPPSLVPNDTAPIPDFWITVIRNHAEVGGMAAERDIPALQSLFDVQCVFLYSTGPRPDFKLKFKFTANNFFTNRVLEKAYYYQDEPDDLGNFEPTYSVGTNIQWKSGKGLDSPDNAGEPSFFDFFTAPVRPSHSHQNRRGGKDGEDTEDEDANEELEEYEEDLEDDFAKGEAFKDEVIPNAIDYFMQEKEEAEDEEFDWENDQEDSSSNSDNNDSNDDDDE